MSSEKLGEPGRDVSVIVANGIFAPSACIGGFSEQRTANAVPATSNQSSPSKSERGAPCGDPGEGLTTHLQLDVSPALATTAASPPTCGSLDARRAQYHAYSSDSRGR